MARARQLPPQAKEIFKSSPSALLSLDTSALQTFIQWTTQVPLPENFEINYLIRQLTDSSRVGVTYMDVATWSLATIEELLKWIEQEGERVELPAGAESIPEVFSTYCDRIYDWQRRIHNYWLQ